MQHTTDRVNLYLAVHKGLRAYMAHTLLDVGRVDPSDADDTARTLQAVRHLVSLCRTHLEHEDTFLHAAMEARRPGSAQTTLDDHAEHVRAFEVIEAAVATVETRTGGARQTAMHTLYALLGQFVADNFAHMHVEETRNNAVLWDAYCDEELLALKSKLMAAIPPEVNMAFLRWMAPSLSPAERAQMFLGARGGMPPAAFEAVLALVKPLLGARDWFKLQTALGSPLAAAA